MNSEITKKYDKYMRETGNIRVGTYEAHQLATLCGINMATLVFLGVRATVRQAPIAIKEGWFIYDLEERIVNQKPTYYITIDNELK